MQFAKMEAESRFATAVIGISSTAPPAVMMARCVCACRLLDGVVGVL